MLTALFISKRSPDPNTQVGAVIVNAENRIMATGYNSYPNGVGSSNFSWARSNEDPLQTKYPYVVHAEKNAIHNATSSIAGCTLYVTMFPCNECAKDIIQSGISKVVYLSNPYKDQWQTEASQRLFSVTDLPVEEHTWKDKSLVLSCLQEMVECLRSKT
jgi:dCMP deaminase